MKPSTKENALAGGRAVDLSIIIVVYQTPAALHRCLVSLDTARKIGSNEIIVVDNSPKRFGAGAVVGGWQGIRYIENAKNVGFAKACNQGMAVANGRYYLILNADVQAMPESVAALFSYIEREPDVGVVAPRLDNPDGTLQESCRTFYTLPVVALRRTILGRLFPDARSVQKHLMRDFDHAQTRDVDWCMAACLCIRKTAVEEVGPMDERFFLYFEDVDWCLRMRRHGWRVVYHPESRMVHEYSRASARRNLRFQWIHLNSALRYCAKWGFS